METIENIMFPWNCAFEAKTRKTINKMLFSLRNFEVINATCTVKTKYSRKKERERNKKRERERMKERWRNIFTCSNCGAYRPIVTAKIVIKMRFVNKKKVSITGAVNFHPVGLLYFCFVSLSRALSYPLFSEKEKKVFFTFLSLSRSCSFLLVLHSFDRSISPSSLFIY